jgi:hypothetical protein
VVVLVVVGEQGKVGVDQGCVGTACRKVKKYDCPSRRAMPDVVVVSQQK